MSGSSRGRTTPTPPSWRGCRSLGRRRATDDRAAAARRGARRGVRSAPRSPGRTCRSRCGWPGGRQAEAEGAGLRWVEGPGERIGVAALVAAAERLQQRDPAYLAELDRWTAPTTVAGGAGVPPSAFGVTGAAGHAAEFPLRDFAGGIETDRPRHAGPVEEHPVVAVLQTGGDRPEDWLGGGQALMRVLLAAAADGYAASYLNQPLELPGLRQQLRDELRLDGWPQLILRLGHPAGDSAPAAPAPPRRRHPAPAELTHTAGSVAARRA